MFKAPETFRGRSIYTAKIQCVSGLCLAHVAGEQGQVLSTTCHDSGVAASALAPGPGVTHDTSLDGVRQLCNINQIKISNSVSSMQRGGHHRKQRTIGPRTEIAEFLQLLCLRGDGLGKAAVLRELQLRIALLQ